MRLSTLSLALLAIVGLAGCSIGSTPQPPIPLHTGPSVSLTSDQAISLLLSNVRDTGYDSDQNLNTGLGGLFQSWAYGSHPLKANFDSSGQSTCSVSPAFTTCAGVAHDPTLDLRYLRILYLYTMEHPAQGEYLPDIQLYTTIVKQEFSSPIETRSYDFWFDYIDLYRLTKDPWYMIQARLQANLWFSENYQKSSGTIYWTDQSSSGNYQPDQVIGEASVFIIAGQLFSRPDWAQAGRSTVFFIYSHAYLSNFKTFPHAMSAVLGTDQNANPCEGFFSSTSYASDNLAIALELTRVYLYTSDENYLKRAQDLLDAYGVTINQLHQWDSTNFGYFSSVTFSGNSYCKPGNPSKPSSSKDTGGIWLAVEAYNLGNSIATGRYTLMIQFLEQTLLSKAFYTNGHGFAPSASATWNLPGGWTKGRIDASATLWATLGLLTLSDPRPW